MTGVPTHLTLADLRCYVQQSGQGLLYPPDATPDWNTPLGPATNDSRTVTPGGLFVALPGEHADGHRFVPDALARGARAVIVTQAPELLPEGAVAWLVPEPLKALQGLAGWWRVQFPDLIAIGITGSVGKTTAKEVTAAALSSQMSTLASLRSFNNEIGLPLTLLSLTGAHRAAVLEMGIYDVGDIAFLAGMARQTIGVVLNVDAVHLERAGSIERIAQAKQEMVDTLQSGGIAVLNHDDPRVRAMRTAAPGPVRTFGLSSGADWQGVDVQPRQDGLTLTLVHQGRRYPLHSALPGRHHAYALLAAAATLEAAGVPVEQIAPALAAVPALTIRQRILRGTDERLIIDDTYNASPLSMLAALDLLATQSAPRRVAILADMLELGEIAVESHRKVGVHAARCADLVIGVGPLAQEIVTAAGAKGQWFADKATLCPALDTILKREDAVLVKGSRGMALEEVVGWLLPPT